MKIKQEKHTQYKYFMAMTKVIKTEEKNLTKNLNKTGKSMSGGKCDMTQGENGKNDKTYIDSDIRKSRKRDV